MSPDPQALPSDGRWLEQAEKLLAGLGFCLTEADPAHGVDAAHLLVAIRPQPTLAHFDPERVEYWATESGRGRPRVLDRETHVPNTSDFAWGQIVLVDRLGVRNEFLSFGGSMRVQTTADGTVYVDCSSHAPILRWSGHSQAVDPMAGEVGAFLARLKVPIDFVPARRRSSRRRPHPRSTAPTSSTFAIGSRRLARCAKRTAGWPNGASRRRRGCRPPCRTTGRPPRNCENSSPRQRPSRASSSRNRNGGPARSRRSLCPGEAPDYDADGEGDGAAVGGVVAVGGAEAEAEAEADAEALGETDGTGVALPRATLIANAISS